jgi:hypothetical protein
MEDFKFIHDSLFKNYIEKNYDITFDKNDYLLFRQNNTIKIYTNVFKYPTLPPSYILISKEKAYNDYVSKYYDENPNEKRRFDIAILEFKKNIEIAKEKKEKLKKYFINKYNLNDDFLLTSLLTNIIKIYLHYIKTNPKFLDIVVFLQDPEIQILIDKNTQETLNKQKERERIEKLKKSRSITTLKEEIKKSESISPLKGPSEKNKDLYKIAEDMIANKEEELNVKINEANDKLKELSGLDNDEIESVINDVMIIIKERINNKSEELKLKENVIKFLNPAQMGDLISLMD